ncbi:MAG: hypothetical protein A2017_01450 [Lentisphaerae bacterium GWF2_44_16]|nr:MAG: hypothetical protein A2017_01450 [Lentisphaerae bacterium GWF2_44_16]
MKNEFKLALIGLDTSHSIEFTRRMQAPDCPAEQKVNGLKAVTCMRFPTPFQNEDGQDKRQKQLEAWGVKVTGSFDEAVKGCDAILIEINDPAFHLDYFKKCAELGKPMFLDKPLADNIQNGAEIVRIAREKNCKMFSSSSLRFGEAIAKSCKEIPAPLYASVYGPLGIAPAGSSIVWYGVHAFEMLQRILGRGAVSVTSNPTGSGVVAVVEYADRRRGVVELTTGCWVYGGSLRSQDKASAFMVDASMNYTLELREICDFLQNGKMPVELDDTLEIMALLDAAERSFQCGGRTVAVLKK